MDISIIRTTYEVKTSVGRYQFTVFKDWDVEINPLYWAVSKSDLDDYGKAIEYFLAYLKRDIDEETIEDKIASKNKFVNIRYNINECSLGETEPLQNTKEEELEKLIFRLADFFSKCNCHNNEQDCKNWCDQQETPSTKNKD